ncbi:MAG TPA: hypothetical protein PLA68_15570 [Panacibacter sp.]|nr:hypothetical protein [Panacibacter sp.]
MIFLSVDDLKVEPFRIEVTFQNKKYNLFAEQSKCTKQIEEFTVTAGKEKKIILRTNRPMIRLTESRKKVDWKIQEPGMKQIIQSGTASFIDDIIKEIMTHVYHHEHPPSDWSKHPKNSGGMDY